MTTEIAPRPTNGHADIVERVLVAGDLARLSPAERECRRCGVRKPLADFYRYRAASPTLRRLCKACHIAESVRHAQVRRGPLPTVAEKFAARIREREDGCVVWIAARTKGGYGQLRIPGTAVPAYVHRLAYEWQVGPIPEGLTIDHLCRTRACVNVAHMELVTVAENNRRSLAIRWAKG